MLILSNIYRKLTPLLPARYVSYFFHVALHEASSSPLPPIFSLNDAQIFYLGLSLI